MFKNLTIKSRLIFFFCFMTAILPGTELVALFGMSNTKNSLTTVYNDRIFAPQQLMDIESLILKNRLAITISLVKGARAWGFPSLGRLSRRWAA
ncbi:Tar ligand binding domain-containing protein [Candidatus Nitrotoga sp. AM1P]|uniref:Tar ligand binding domain-containing protein n=1 Tax=Candidatus Nitrotoga sp. AM1P TaxID=2559597 RepID=UPI001564ABA2